VSTNELVTGTVGRGAGSPRRSDRVTSASTHPEEPTVTTTAPTSAPTTTALPTALPTAAPGPDLVETTSPGVNVTTVRLPHELDQAAALLEHQLRWQADVRPGSIDVADELALLRHPGPWARLLLAHRDERTVGVARIQWGPARRAGEVRRAQLTHVFVVPDERRAGVGEALVRRAAILAWWNGCHDLHVTTWSREATGMLHRIGFREEPGTEGLLLSVRPAS
jgi:GNAT superfamily N-acetyltransferase